MSTFLNKIDKLRLEPEHKRERVRLVATIGITAVVAIIWFSTLSLRFSNPTQTTIAQKADQESSVFSSAAGRVGAGWAVVKGTFKD